MNMTLAGWTSKYNLSTMKDAAIHWHPTGDVLGATGGIECLYQHAWPYDPVRQWDDRPNCFTPSMMVPKEWILPVVWDQINPATGKLMYPNTRFLNATIKACRDTVTNVWIIRAKDFQLRVIAADNFYFDINPVPEPAFPIKVRDWTLANYLGAREAKAKCEIAGLKLIVNVACPGASLSKMLFSRERTDATGAIIEPGGIGQQVDGVCYEIYRTKDKELWRQYVAQGKMALIFAEGQELYNQAMTDLEPVAKDFNGKRPYCGVYVAMRPKE